MEVAAYRRWVSREELIITPQSLHAWTTSVPDYDSVMSNVENEAAFTELPPPSYAQVMLEHDLWLEKCTSTRNFDLQMRIKRIMKIKVLTELENLIFEDAL